MLGGIGAVKVADRRDRLGGDQLLVGDRVGSDTKTAPHRIDLMTPAGQTAPHCSLGEGTLDADSVAWLKGLRSVGPLHDATNVRLYELLLRVARSEARRRSSAQLGIAGAELDDLAHQAAADAMVLVVAKAGEFRGESRFTTWACKFAIFELSTKIGRHVWRHPTTSMDTEAWDRLPDRFGLDPAEASEWGALIAALHAAVDRDLTDHQRRIFIAIVLNGMPLDALVAELGSNRNAVYKTLFDARRKLRASLVTNGYLADDSSRRT
jgi:RNA polymerase sigma-70 factor (ECF subfamily)